MLQNLDFDRIIVGTFTGLYEISKQLIQMGIKREKIDTSYIEVSVKARENFVRDFAKEFIESQVSEKTDSIESTMDALNKSEVLDNKTDSIESNILSPTHHPFDGKDSIESKHQKSHHHNKDFIKSSQTPTQEKTDSMESKSQTTAQEKTDSIESTMDVLNKSEVLDNKTDSIESKILSPTHHPTNEKDSMESKSQTPTHRTIKKDYAVAEVGVYRGDFARVINESFKENRFYLFDTFEGFSVNDMQSSRDGVMRANLGVKHFANTSVELVLGKMPFPQNCVIKKGWFPSSASDLDSKEKFCFVNLDCDLYEPILAGLKFFYPRMCKGGIILVHEYFSNGYVGVKKAVDEFFIESKLPTFHKFPIGDNLSIAILKT
nr:TylF/MycF/NovP-related O-methyltransferase [Helicobacter saguini]